MTDEQSTSTRRIEEASLNAWPALHQILLDGWLLRFSHGFTMRANSIVPLYPVLEPMEDKVRHCENLYARERLKTIFRLTSLNDCRALDVHLDSRGYERVDPTEVLTAELAGLTLPAPTHSRDLPIRYLPREQWLEIYGSLTGMPEQASQLHGAILKGIQNECVYAVLDTGEGPVACGLAVQEQRLMGLFDIYTHQDHRGHGHAELLVGALLSRGRAQGADTAYLQMVSTNSAARGLYAKFGFSPAYEYWYRVSA